MEKERPDERQTGDKIDDTAPAVVLPSPNTQGMSGGLQGFPSSLSAIAPQPLLDPTGGDADSLAARVEDALAEDGRFTALVAGLVIDAGDGAVRLSGTGPSEGRRQSLLSAVRAVPGVGAVSDDLRVG